MTESERERERERGEREREGRERGERGERVYTYPEAVGDELVVVVRQEKLGQEGQLEEEDVLQET